MSSPPLTTNEESIPNPLSPIPPPSRGNQSIAAPRASSAPSWINALRRPRTSPGPRSSSFKYQTHLSGDIRRDSGLDPSSASTGTHAASDNQNLTKIPSLPTIVVHDDESGSGYQSHGSRHVSEGSSSAAEPFLRITTPIPTGNLDDFTAPDTLEFSKRGSILLSGKRVADGTSVDRSVADCGKSVDRSDASIGSNPVELEPRIPTPPAPKQRLRIPPIRGRPLSGRVLSMDDAILSRKVRTMYDYGDERAGDLDRPYSSFSTSDHGLVQENDGELPDGGSLMINRTLSPNSARPASAASSCRGSLFKREPFELAGGVEDWEDVAEGQVDRYGFILPKPTGSRNSSTSPSPDDSPGLVRVATSLQLAAETPRRKRTIRRSPSRQSARVTSADGPKRRGSKRSARSPASVYTNHTVTSVRTTTSTFRNATNRLPHNRERRIMDEAGDMLTLPHELAELEGETDGGRTVSSINKKEWEREEKWRKMAKAKPRSGTGGGMDFDFDTKDAKLISRTWKGIPDKWRAKAWYSFLEASVRKTSGAPTHEELVEHFHELQDESSADDVQIDVDVPRTIGRHIMFRRRYRGGQRLLFRVLHALSLYFPETGYVQGMAALAATFLCYYDEENAFVMMVRLWHHRGLDHLYQSGFGGLMESLEDFEKNWLVKGNVAKKLDELNVSSTSYGTRWYLTLFNYSIPFPAQLRVWDVFMLLGDDPSSVTTGTDAQPSFGGDLDVLHATSAALIDATREILLDSDFENAMKTLTSFLPIKDEEILMRVAKAEWKQKRKRMGKKV
ncbi:RabGAP/TBC [Eremomyces bilateralis CBS 781.70]|uniref:RabGAP/TBC n=1 Tax=Eremomyces bilateralis CBS 781.70 TaxID=1392243 RepID=A0A6G1FTK4_9PEZI|nr:RabGAP/TBC [Eremomyces bilateralis CBS 781.70]KAF1809056.1 RabGAP/TBC [Eremomyces bilateralis CBS 781.70]